MHFLKPVRPIQLRFIEAAKPLSARFGPDFFRAIPKSPGVYLMKGADEKLLYVGKSVNLRQRVSSYRYLQPEKHSRKLIRLIHEVRHLSWEVCESDIAAQLRENFLLRTHRPKFNKANTYPKAYFFIAVAERSNGYALSLTREPDPAEKIFGAFKVSAMHAFAALLRWIWIQVHQPKSVHDFAPRMFTSRLRHFFVPDQLLLADVEAFLDGTSKKLLELCPRKAEFAQTPFGEKLAEADLETLTQFFDKAACRNREFRARFGVVSKTISPEALDDFLVMNRTGKGENQ